MSVTKVAVSFNGIKEWHLHIVTKVAVD